MPPDPSVERTYLGEAGRASRVKRERALSEGLPAVPTSALGRRLSTRQTLL